MTTFPTVERLINEASFLRPEAEIACIMGDLRWINSVLDDGNGFQLLSMMTPLQGGLLFKALVMKKDTPLLQVITNAVIRAAKYMEKGGYRDRYYAEAFYFKISDFPALVEYLTTKEVQYKIEKSSAK